MGIVFLALYSAYVSERAASSVYWCNADVSLDRCLQPMLISRWYFNSVHHEVCWGLLWLCVVPEMIVRLLTGLYFWAGSAVKLWECTAFFYEHGSEAGLHLCRINFHHLYGLGTKHNRQCRYPLAITGSQACTVHPLLSG